MDYGTIGYEYERLDKAFSALPWWLWPLKWHYRRKLRKSHQRMYRAQFIRVRR